MNIERSFLPGDRYLYDFELCTPSKGFAQVDTQQDASYYGNWANPFDFILVSYCEGDVTKTTCNNAEEFKEKIRYIKTWNEENGYRFCGVDPLCNAKLEQQFINLGLSDLFHPFTQKLLKIGIWLKEASKK
jgi:hypothetical protein